LPACVFYHNNSPQGYYISSTFDAQSGRVWNIEVSDFLIEVHLRAFSGRDQDLSRLERKCGKGREEKSRISPF
jgi:hypothetical protein